MFVSVAFCCIRVLAVGGMVVLWYAKSKEGQLMNLHHNPVIIVILIMKAILSSNI